MGLAMLATGDDVEAIVGYLKTKPTGATVDDARAALDKSLTDTRKISAYLRWGFVTKEGGRLKLGSLGRELSRAGPEAKASVYARVLRGEKAYRSTLDWIFHQGFGEVTNTEVAAQWHEHHRPELGTDNETTIKAMGVCFLRLCQAGSLGLIMVGRRGQPTRLEIDKEALGQFIGEGALLPKEPPREGQEEEGEITEEVREPIAKPRIFISHGKNMDVVEQIKTMVELGDLKYEIAEEEETGAIPVPEKVLAAMRRCSAAVICVTADEDQKGGDGSYGINQNVLVEIGAAFVLYHKRVVLLWDKRVDVPSNLQGLYRCEFSGDELSWSAGMKLMKAVSRFKAKGGSD